jgi:CheY-like chemotaxis protein
MDINMPKVSGIAAMHNIKEIEKDKKKKTPVVALTANTLKGDREKFLEIGFDDYLPKPFDEKDLDRVLHKYLQIYEEIPKNEPKKTNLKKTDSSLPPELLERLQNIFKNNIGEDMSGLIQAFKNNDFKNIFYYSHKIKGAAGNIGYEEIYNLTKEIEFLAKNNKKDEKLLQKLQQEIEKIKA